MAEIDELQGRIAIALARISARLEAVAERPAQMSMAGLDMAAPGQGGDAALQEALDEERMANAQLKERIKALHVAETGMMAQIEGLTQQLDEQGLEVQRLVTTVGQLREELRRLREAAEAGATDPTLINRAMLAELESLRTTRAAEATEMNDILSALGDVLEKEEARANA